MADFLVKYSEEGARLGVKSEHKECALESGATDFRVELSEGDASFAVKFEREGCTFESGVADRHVELSEESVNFAVKFEHEKPTFAVGMAETQIIEVPVPGLDIETYSGDYAVTPKVTGQTLETAQKYMEQDVKVQAIPFYEVSNPSGGNTVYIGTEV